MLLAYYPPSKKMMKTAAKRRLGISCVDDNQADGLWVTVCGCDFIGDVVVDRQSPKLPGLR